MDYWAFGLLYGILWVCMELVKFCMDFWTFVWILGCSFSRV